MDGVNEEDDLYNERVWHVDEYDGPHTRAVTSAGKVHCMECMQLVALRRTKRSGTLDGQFARRFERPSVTGHKRSADVMDM
jgi:hypothetical protein